MADELLSWLRSTIEGDKAAAEKAQPGPWHIGNAVDPTRPCNVHTFPGARGVANELPWLDAEHIVRHDPRDTIARCEAELRLIALCEGSTEYALKRPQGNSAYLVAHQSDILVRLLASGYRHRPHFHPEWVSE